MGWFGLVWFGLNQEGLKLRGKVPVRWGNQVSRGQVLPINNPRSEQARNQEIQRNERENQGEDFKEITMAVFCVGVQSIIKSALLNFLKSFLDHCVGTTDTSYRGQLARTRWQRRKILILGPQKNLVEQPLKNNPNEGDLMLI